MDTIEYSVKGLCEEIALYLVLEKGTSSRETNSTDASNPGNPGSSGGNGNTGNGNTSGSGSSSPYK